MKALISGIALALAIGGTTVVAQQSQDSNMLKEMEKCAVCKVMLTKPDLMKNMTWETHKIANGMFCLATVPKDQKKDFDAVHELMTQAIAKVKADQKAGKPVEMCEFCVGLGELEKLNVKQEEILTSTGGVHLVTSTDPAVVKKIHALADKAIAEQKKMSEQSQVRTSN